MAHSRRGSGGLRRRLRCLRLCGSLRGWSCRLRLLSRLFRSILCRFCCGILTYRLCSLSGFGRLRCRSFLLFSRGSSRSGRCGRSAGLQCVCSSSCRLLSLLLGSGVSNLEAMNQVKQHLRLTGKLLCGSCALCGGSAGHLHGCGYLIHADKYLLYAVRLFLGSSGDLVDDLRGVVGLADDL